MKVYGCEREIGEDGRRVGEGMKEGVREREGGEEGKRVGERRWRRETEGSARREVGRGERGKEREQGKRKERMG